MLTRIKKRFSNLTESLPNKINVMIKYCNITINGFTHKSHGTLKRLLRQNWAYIFGNDDPVDQRLREEYSLYLAQGDKEMHMSKWDAIQHYYLRLINPFHCVSFIVSIFDSIWMGVIDYLDDDHLFTVQPNSILAIICKIPASIVTVVLQIPAVLLSKTIGNALDLIVLDSIYDIVLPLFNSCRSDRIEPLTIKFEAPVVRLSQSTLTITEDVQKRLEESRTPRRYKNSGVTTTTEVKKFSPEQSPLTGSDVQFSPLTAKKTLGSIRGSESPQEGNSPSCTVNPTLISKLNEHRRSHSRASSVDTNIRLSPAQKMLRRFHMNRSMRALISTEDSPPQPLSTLSSSISDTSLVTPITPISITPSPSNSTTSTPRHLRTLTPIQKLEHVMTLNSVNEEDRILTPHSNSK